MKIADVTVSARRVHKETAVGAENKVKLPRDFVQDINCYLLLMDAAALLFAVLSIELGWNGTGWASTRRTELLKALVSVVSVASVVVVLVRYRYQLRCKVERPPTMLMLALEVTVHLLHVPPSLTDRFEVGAVNDYHRAHYPMDNLNALLVMRLYILVRVICEQSYYDDENVMAVGSLNHVEINHGFVIKCIIRRSPMLSLGLGLLWTTFWGAYNIRLWERSLTMEGDLAESSADWSNAFWLVFVTMTSVGYGDHSPVTHLGRLTASICVLSFTLFISLFIGVVADEMQLGSSQEKVYEYADSHANHQRVRSIASEVIAQFLRAKSCPYLHPPSWWQTNCPGFRRRTTKAARAKAAARRLIRSTESASHNAKAAGPRHQTKRKTLMRNMSLLIVKAQTGSAYGFDENSHHGSSGVSLRLLARFRRVLELHKRAQQRARPTQYEKQNNTMFDWIRMSQEREAQILSTLRALKKDNETMRMQHDALLGAIHDHVVSPRVASVVHPLAAGESLDHARRTGRSPRSRPAQPAKSPPLSPQTHHRRPSDVSLGVRFDDAPRREGGGVTLSPVAHIAGSFAGADDRGGGSSAS